MNLSIYRLGTHTGKSEVAMFNILKNNSPRFVKELSNKNLDFDIIPVSMSNSTFTNS